MNHVAIPTAAQLPRTYQAAKTALAECQAIDECKEWADKAAALASYAKQAEDVELEQMAARIRARAMRRAGELLKQFDGRPANHERQKDGSVHLPPTQKDVADKAGMSERQVKTAVRIANVPQDDFDKQVESSNPPTISTLALQGMQKRKPLNPESWLKGRDPAAYNKALHFVAAIEEYADDLAKADLDLILPNLDAEQATAVRRAIARIDSIHDMIVTRV